jgi:UDP-2,4-diacetamido-2,4,6-trideoxy-beta-L-altropyranose hydrolase
MSKPVIYFRADGNSKMGLGHVIRSLALAEMLSENFECRFIIRNPLPQLLLEIKKVCSHVIQLDSIKFDYSEAAYLTKEILSREDILVLDGYHFESEYQKIIKGNGNKLVCIDDIHSFHFYADAIINHAPEVVPASYSAEPYTKFLLGLNYSLLRRPFLEAAQEKRSVLAIGHIFICFGGSDFNNLTLKAIKGTLDVPGVDSVHVILGGANVHKSEISAFAEKDDRYKIYENVSGERMLEVMKKCDLAIVPASSILYEIISVKMPVISGHYVENQINVYHGFDALNLIKGIGDFNKFDDYKKVISDLGKDEIDYYINQQNKFLDGKSRDRFIKEFEALIPKKITIIRKAKISDLMTYFQWANDPFVRKNAINQEQIKLSDHKVWFENRILSKDYMYVLEHDGEPAGQVRFDIKNTDAIISYALGRNFRGKGLGKKILDLGIEAYEKEASSEISRLVGWVKLTNKASNKIFQKLQFVLDEEKEYEGEQYNIYIKSL